MAPAKPKTGRAKAAAASEFQKIITEARERRENEKLANQIFSKNRRQSADPRALAGGSLRSPAGIQKKTSTRPRARASLPSAGDINGRWNHDLHEFNPPRGPRALQGPSLASRISLPSDSAAVRTRASKRTARLAAAAIQAESDPSSSAQVNILRRAEIAPAKPQGMTIRGLAGPFTVLAQNFAEGTTEADIESAMTPIGGEMISCRILKTRTPMLVEMVFTSREGGEQVIETFNDKTADGRLLQVWSKAGGYSPSGAGGGSPSKHTGGQLIDGMMGIIEGTADAGAGSRSGSKPLYSDKLIGGRGRGRSGRARGDR